jgi:uncharacterized protein
MRIILDKKPKNPTIINGFPGFGFVGSIALEFLINHLKVEQIGKIILEEMPAMVAIHEGKKIDPFGIFYNKQYNLLIVHAVAPTHGLEWKISDFVVEIAKMVQAKEVITLEGVAGSDPKESQTFSYANVAKNKDRFKKAGIKPLQEGIIIGVAGALLMKTSKLPLSCVFSETHTALPDSKAAAKIIEALDKYLGLEVDYKPLLQQAENFEQKLQNSYI